MVIYISELHSREGFEKLLRAKILVKEFYANAKEHEDFKMFAWVHWVRFDSFPSIDSTTCGDIPDDEYFRLRDKGDSAFFIFTLTSTEWKRSIKLASQYHF